MTVHCPRCTFALQSTTAANNVIVDGCPRCGGAFYEQMDAITGLDPNAEIKKLCAAGTAKALPKSGLSCPQGHGPLLRYRCEAPDQQGVTVDIDVCQDCKGLWLDKDEGRALQTVAAQSAQVKSGVGWYLAQLFTGLPLEVYHPVRRRPVMVWSVIIACIVVFAVELWLAASDQLPALFATFGLIPNELLHGRQLWSAGTHMFLHGGGGHLFGNMAFLYIFGDNIEDRIGPRRFLLFYLLCGLAAGGAQFASGYNSEVPMVGASGAIAGMLGAYMVLFPRIKIYYIVFFIRLKLNVWFYLGGWIMTNLALGSMASFHGAGSSAGVAWWAHVGGFAAGALVGLVTRKSILA